MLLPMATRLAGEQITGLGSPALDMRVFAFAVLLSLTTAVLFGMAPALHAARAGLGEALNAGRAVVAGKGTPRALRMLLVLEVALAVVLLMGSGLLLESFRRQNAVNPGYAPDHVLTLRASVLPRAYPDGASIISFWDRIITRLEALPGVEAVATTMFDMPIRGSGWTTFFGVHGRPLPAARNEWRAARFALVGGDYFGALDLAVRRGRALTPEDNQPGAERVVVINESLARAFFPGADPLNQRVWLFGPGDMDAIVVGIVEDMRLNEVTAEPEPTVYVATAQTTHGVPGTQWIMLRTTGDPAQVTGAVRSAIHAVDRSVAIDRIESLESVVRTSFAPQRFRTLVLGVFAAVALLVAGVGLYGVVAYIVTRERRDIGIRMALGARKVDAVARVFRQVLGAVSLGLAVGVVAALLLARLFSGLLFGVPPANPTTLMTVTAVLLVVALAACLGPARSAAAIAPTEAMRAN
jgi:predicted permease